jgi:ketosteroid isomerase-like protein
MADDETHIRELIERWARAVRTGDLAGVLADHAEDIVMYDVPPPYQGIKGIDEYGRSWPAFFDWQGNGCHIRANQPGHHSRRHRCLRARPVALRHPRRPGEEAGVPAAPDPRPCARRRVGGSSRTSTIRSLTTAARTTAMVRGHRGEGPRRPHEASVESWSRGTRVFQRTGRGWEMAHQHVSFPFDLETGQARTDLAPTTTTERG